MAQKTALLLNDTANAYHWGCFGTSTEIRRQLEGRGYIVDSFSVVSVQNANTPPQNSAHMLDAGFARAFIADNPKLSESIAAADVVIVNGEGTLHGSRQSAFNLLYLIRLAKERFDKPVYVINTSVFPNDDGRPGGAIGQLYQAMLSHADGITVRDSLSLTVAKNLQLDATLGFDCLPLFLSREEVISPQSDERPVVIGGGLGLEPKRFQALVGAVSQAAQGHALCYLTGAAGHVAQDDAPLIEAAATSVPNLEHRVASSFEQWAGTIKNAACLVSGRFHHSIAAAFLDTPVIAFKAATPKVDALCNDLGLDLPLDPADEESESHAAHRLRAILRGDTNTIGPARRQAALDAAQKNFAYF